MQRALAALRIAETDAPATPTAEVPMDDEDTEVTAPAGLREALDELETTSQTFNVFVRPPRKG